MKRRTGKKIGKILLLVILAAVVGVIVYTVMVWPMYPDRQKPAESYQHGGNCRTDRGRENRTHLLQCGKEHPPGEIGPDL